MRDASGVDDSVANVADEGGGDGGRGVDRVAVDGLAAAPGPARIIG